MCQFFAHKARTLAQTCARICAQFPKPGQSIYLPAAASSNTSISRLLLTARYFSLWRRLRANLSPAAARRRSTEQGGRGDAGRCMPVGRRRTYQQTVGGLLWNMKILSSLCVRICFNFCVSITDSNVPISNANKVVSDNKDVIDDKRGTYQKNLNHSKELVNLK